MIYWLVPLPKEGRQAEKAILFYIKKKIFLILYTKPVVHFDFKKVVPLIEFQTIKYNEQPRAKLQKNS